MATGITSFSLVTATVCFALGLRSQNLETLSTTGQGYTASGQFFLDYATPELPPMTPLPPASCILKPEEPALNWFRRMRGLTSAERISKPF